MAGWYRVVKTIKGHRYLYAQRTWREGAHVRTQSRYLGKAGDAGTGTISGAHTAQAGLSDAGKTVYHGSEIRFTGTPSTKPNRYGKLGQGFYITDDLTTAQNYSGENGEVKEYNVSPEAKFINDKSLEFQAIKNKAIDNLQAQGEISTPMQIDDEVRRLVEIAGYDGIEAFNQAVVFNPKVLKERIAQQPTGERRDQKEDGQLTLRQAPARREDIYTTITDRIVADLEKGVRPWDRPWRGGWPSRPLRFNGEPYRGINILMLWLTAAERGYSSPHWMTFKQARELGGHIRKGEKGTQIAYANTFQSVKLDQDGNPIRDKRDNEIIEEIPYLKGYTVFNVDQIDCLPDKYRVPVLEPLDQSTRIKNADELIAKTGADISHGGDKAYYSPGTDHIQLPLFATFKEPEGYVATAVHELVHWTSHPKRLDRSFGRERWGDEGYAMEELVAELGAAFVCADLGIAPKTRDEHSSYIGSWLRVLKSDKRAIFAAASHAQKAVDYLHGEREG